MTRQIELLKMLSAVDEIAEAMKKRLRQKARQG
jgi:hypothetical protein